MKPAKGYYSIIQYCPDLSRLEAANIGVLLFYPERQFLEARMERGHGRVQKLFGSEGHDWSRIESFKRTVDERLQTEGHELKRSATCGRSSLGERIKSRSRRRGRCE